MKDKKPPHELLDAVIEKQRLRNDSHLADELDVPRAVLSRFRHNTPVTASFKLILQRKYGMTIKEIDKLAPPVKEKA